MFIDTVFTLITVQSEGEKGLLGFMKHIYQLENKTVFNEATRSVCSSVQQASLSTPCWGYKQERTRSL